MHRASYDCTSSVYVLPASEAAELSGEAVYREEVGRFLGEMVQLTALAPLVGALVTSLRGARRVLDSGGGLPGAMNLTSTRFAFDSASSTRFPGMMSGLLAQRPRDRATVGQRMDSGKSRLKSP